MFSSLPILAAALALAQSAATSLTNVAAVAAAVRKQSGVGENFSFTADVLYKIDHANGIMLLLSDAHDSIVAHYDPLWLSEPVRIGDRMRANGYLSDRSGFSVRPSLTNVAFIGQAAIPAFPKRDIASILRGDVDWRPARVEGLLRDAARSETNPDWFRLVLCDSGGSLYVSLPKGRHTIADFTDLIGRRLSVDGFAVPFDGSLRHHQGNIFQCAGFDHLTPAGRENFDPFASTDLAFIGNQTPEVVASLGLHSATGTVLAAWQGRNVLLRTTAGKVVRIELQDDNPPRPGERILAAGLPESDLFHINLSHARWRPIGGHASLPAAKVATAAQILGSRSPSAIDASWHGRRIRLKGILRGKESKAGEESTLILECGSHIITVERGDFPSLPPRPPTGSEVEATGICTLSVPIWTSAHAFPQITGFTLVLDTADGFRVLSTPSWWTPVRLLIVIGILLLILAGIVVWNVSLRRLAERKGRELLRAELKDLKSQLRITERTRLSVELHDSLAQTLSCVAMELDTAHAIHASDPRQTGEHLSGARRALQFCREELRNCLWDLRSEALDEPDMSRAILRTLKPQIDDARLRVRFNVPRSRLSDPTAHAILRIVRELVVNAIRHGRATAVRVAGSLDQDCLRFAVTDNGCGFDPAHRPGIEAGHFGLQGVIERVGRLNGQTEIESAPGHGTRISVTLLLPRLSDESVSKDEGSTSRNHRIGAARCRTYVGEASCLPG